ncbi:MAG: class I SAM-dependent methyltransferase [Noviherbaspirillum sp.]
MTASTISSREDIALSHLLGYLGAQNYRFITTTPVSHAHVLARHGGKTGATLRDVFGWNLAFDPGLLPPQTLSLLDEAGLLEPVGNYRRSKVRVSSIDDALFLHSAFPTEQEDAVFFGPDTYRFIRFMRQALENAPPLPGARILDIGCGSGAGGLMLSKQCPRADLMLNDINPLALRYAALNAHASALKAQLALGDSLAAVQGNFDLIIANPPYMVDKDARTYRHGGDGLGSSLSLSMAMQSLPRLKPGGCLLLYTGVAIVDSRDGFLEELTPALNSAGYSWRYEEIDPDVFGEELTQPAYQKVDRIAAVGLVARAPS